MSNLNPVGFIPGTFRVPHVYGSFPNGSRVMTRQATHMPNLAMAPNGLMQNVHINNTPYLPGVLPVGNAPRNVPLQMRMINHQPSIKQSLGACKMRLLSFANYLESDTNIKKKDDITHWVDFTKQFFDENTSMNYSSRSRKFEIKYQLIPRFYQTFFESGVTKIQLILGITQESIQQNNGILVECKSASIMYHYENGMQVVETGRLSVTFVNLKITNFEFEAEKYTEYVPRQLLNEFITNSQESLINEHGIPHKTMRCLEVGEGVDFMQEVMTVTINNPNIGPLEALRIIASQTNPNVATPMVNHPLEMSSSPSQSVSKKDIKNDVSNFSGAPPTPNANDLQTSTSTPVGTPTPIHTPTPTPKSTPSPLVMNSGAIGSPHQKLTANSPAIENTVKRPNDGGFNANKKRPRASLKSPKK